ncbi:hypothetical protein O6H91_05G078200 [Diphasiastrum complanatum]|uniref:Uncharacterized protein n=1 Tax=Diphasiastrum complanatum TaxID=34168 RepID=A0ACC2DQT8_DIPCM|nr:hypothetical protein O6H91_05G078200 [Diphasiastrum complanatum]
MYNSQRGVTYKDFYNNENMNYGSSGMTRYRELYDETYGLSDRGRYEDDQQRYSNFTGYRDLHDDGSYGATMGSGSYRNYEDGRYMLLGGGRNKSSDKRPMKPLPKYQTVVLKVQIHCEECIRKVKKTLAKMDGVESVRVDEKQQRVTVTGNIDPQKVLKKAMKTGKSVELLTSRDPINKPMSYDNRTGGFSNAAGVYSSASFTNADKNRTTLSYPASRDDAYGSYVFNDENANSCSIM